MSKQNRASGTKRSGNEKKQEERKSKQSKQEKQKLNLDRFADLIARASDRQISTLHRKLSRVESRSGNPILKKRILSLTKEGKYGQARLNLLELARKLSYPVSDIEEAISQLELEGYDIAVNKGIVERLEIPGPKRGISHMQRLDSGGWVRFGVLGDTQLGNRNQRLDALTTAYEDYQREGITTVYHTGNLVDGFSININAFELLPEAGSSMESQTAYAGSVYPKIPGITTYFITGECHEGWWVKRQGINVGRFMESRFLLPLSCSEIVRTEHKGYSDRCGRRSKSKCTNPDHWKFGPRCGDATVSTGFCSRHGRRDLRYLGHEEADIELRIPKLKPTVRGPIVRSIHPGGGTAYALSYKTQKLAESLQGGEKPQVQLVGHYHKYDKNYHREVYNLQTGCLEDQTIFMRKNHIGAHVGYLKVEMYIGSDGVVERFKDEFKPFYDRGFYKQYRSW